MGCPNDITLIGDKLYFSEFWIASFHNEPGDEREIFRNRVYEFSLIENKLDRARMNGGKAGPVHPFVDLDKMELEGPDGMAIAEDGRIFLALYRSGKLLVLNADGSPVGYLPTGPLTTNCIFAADGKTLYITADNKLKRIIIP